MKEKEKGGPVKKCDKTRLWYALAFLLLLALEVVIALFVRDSFIRPYGGDVLVTVLLCCFCRILWPKRLRLLPVYVFLFAAAVEIGQYFDIVDLLGLSGNVFFRTLIGTTFSWADLVCYGAGCLLFFTAETMLRRTGD